ncbi:TonB-dependent receptor [Thermococcus sp. 21S9]|uniref:TonB-dependent receptor n=1 Tax=Thermococcus sp. 21S9 TaxID=1638223 RepID=UPI00143888E7|nr:TonB-dependent receptor [Thermococcus sp. 21S9]NJE54620.1 TonB-dependent receptor [Thermococcus sp. 21S9]
MGHTVYYRTRVDKWERFRDFVERVAEGIGYHVQTTKESLTIDPGHPLVEPLVVEKSGEGFAKTNLVEPHHSIYLLVLHSVAFFGSVELWED